MTAGEDSIRWRTVTAEDRQRIAEAARKVLAGRPWVRGAYLFGSAARGDRPARDVDIGLLVATMPADWGADLEIGPELADVAGIHDVPFDVRILNGGDPVFLNNVLRDAILLYETDREARIRFEGRRSCGGGRVSEAHLTLLAEMLELLERYSRTVTRAEIERDRETWLKVKAALEVAAQCAIDLALALVAGRALGVPQSYRDAFGMLARAGVIDGSLADELAKWAGLRNVLVHVYTGLDLDRICLALGQTAPLRAFHAAAVRELIR